MVLSQDLENTELNFNAVKHLRHFVQHQLIGLVPPRTP